MGLLSPEETVQTIHGAHRRREPEGETAVGCTERALQLSPRNSAELDWLRVEHRMCWCLGFRV